MSKKDQLFTGTDAPSKDFRFTTQVAEVFDDMLERSVPFYKETTAMAAQILAVHLKKGDIIYDLGCSTGTTLIELSRSLNDFKLRFIGIDNSDAMINKASLKAKMYSKDIRFIKEDIADTELQAPGGVIMNYTLQFVRPMQRLDFVKKIYNSMRVGGVLLLSEKTVSPDSGFNRDFIGFYLDFKRQQGYSEIEISQKREALENILIPFSCAENLDLLQKAGFAKVDQFFQWFNFSCFAAVK